MACVSTSRRGPGGDAVPRSAPRSSPCESGRRPGGLRASSRVFTRTREPCASLADDHHGEELALRADDQPAFFCTLLRNGFGFEPTLGGAGGGGVPLRHRTAAGFSSTFSAARDYKTFGRNNPGSWQRLVEALELRPERCSVSRRPLPPTTGSPARECACSNARLVTRRRGALPELGHRGGRSRA